MAKSDEKARTKLGFSRFAWCPLSGIVRSIQEFTGNTDLLCNLRSATWAVVSPVEIALSSCSAGPERLGESISKEPLSRPGEKEDYTLGRVYHVAFPKWREYTSKQHTIEKDGSGSPVGRTAVLGGSECLCFEHAPGPEAVWA